MGRRSKPSIVREVKESLKAIDRIGQSKRDAKDAGKSGIHSYNQQKHAMSVSQNFAKWCREEHGVKSMENLTQEHYKAYMAHLADREVSLGHQRNVETSLRLLEKGFKKRSERFKDQQKTFKGFCTEKRLVIVKSTEGACNRSYSEYEGQKIRENCSPEVQKAIDLMRNLGFRVEESVKVRAEHFKDDGNGWRVDIENGNDVTKGGRFRKFDVPKAFEGHLAQLVREAESRGDGRLVQVQEGTVRKAINRACDRTGIEKDARGAHGFRHAYARERFAQMATGEQKQMMNRIIENRLAGRPADYALNNARMKELYDNTKTIMDRVNDELGHGKDRWDLCVRYLQD